MSRDEALRRLGYGAAWVESGVLDDALLEEQLRTLSDDEEAPEHFRWAMFVACLPADQPAIDVAAIRAMSEPHRAWATAILVAALGRGDSRALTALTELGLADIHSLVEEARR